MKFFKATSLVFLTLSIVLGAGFGLNVAKAQKFVKFSSSEDVAIAFYKTGGVVPNFENWIKKRKPYKYTPVARRPRVMKSELTRLKTAYTGFKPNSNYLTIRTFVSLEPTEVTDQTGKKTYTLPISFINAPDALYFPYDFMQQRIVVLPIKLDKLMNSSISKAKYDYIAKAKRSSHQHTMIITLRPKKADLDKPYDIDGLSQWALTADIVSMEVWDKSKKLIWEYTAPWYLAPEQQKLNDLYADRPTEASEKGSVKSAVPYTLDFEN